MFPRRATYAFSTECTTRGTNMEPISAVPSFRPLRHEAPYRSPLTAAQPDHGEVVAWLRLGTAVSGRRVAAVTALFKDAVLSKHQRIHGDPPAVLHGHGFGVSGYEIARFLALPDVGFRRSRGRIHGLALWMPPGSDSVVRRRARDAAGAVRRLTGRGIDVSVAPRDDEQRPVAAHPDRWLRSSHRWTTAFPAIHERRGALDLAEVSRWCKARWAACAGRIPRDALSARPRRSRSGAGGSGTGQADRGFPIPTSSSDSPSRCQGPGGYRRRTAARVRPLCTSRIAGREPIRPGDGRKDAGSASPAPNAGFRCVLSSDQRA